jgi:hypothetical protein
MAQLGLWNLERDAGEESETLKSQIGMAQKCLRARGKRQIISYV